jgi:hypothetical protein
MRLPGFTAELALAEAGEHYHHAAISADTQQTGGVVPQGLCCNCTAYGCVCWDCFRGHNLI